MTSNKSLRVWHEAPPFSLMISAGTSPKSPVTCIRTRVGRRSSLILAFDERLRSMGPLACS